MFAVTNFDGILKQEKENKRKQIVIMLLVKPSDAGADFIINKFNYLHHKSKRYCSIYAVGYSENQYINGEKAYIEVDGIDRNKWYYSDKVFIEFQEELEERLKWRYSGEPELIILQSNPESNVYLTFQNAVTLDINYAIKKGYIESFPRFMERLVSASKAHVTAREASNATGLFSIKSTIMKAFEESDKIPNEIKRIVHDRQFYKACNSKQIS